MNENNIRIPVKEIKDLVYQAFITHGIDKGAAMSVTNALIEAQASGQKAHGISRVPIYIAQIDNGKINKDAKVELEEVSPVMIRVNANFGLAFPAIDLAIEELSVRAKKYGIACGSIYNSHHFGQAGWHCERIATKGLVGMMFGNAPAAMSLWQGSKRMLGTNPIAFAAPNPDKTEPIVIDVALSKIARGKVMSALQKGETIPSDWAYDKHGKETTDPDKAIKGLMKPMGEFKGVALAVMVEIIAACVGGGNLAHSASSVLDDKGQPPRLAQTMFAIEPYMMSGGEYQKNISDFINLCGQDNNARMPGISRIKNRQNTKKLGLEIDKKILNTIKELIKRAHQD